MTKEICLYCGEQEMEGHTTLGRRLCTACGMTILMVSETLWDYRTPNKANDEKWVSSEWRECPEGYLLVVKDEEV
jgi:hypothetical protein